MKRIKKLAALALALIMVLGLATTASAYTITMAPSADGSGVAGHTYEVYQIYTGTMSEIDGKQTLGEVKYGQNYPSPVEGVELVPEEDLALIAAMSGEAAAEYFEAQVTGDPIATLDDSNNHTSVDLASGYYLIIDVSENLPDTETSSAFILEVLNNVAVKSKHESSPITEKKIDDTNDSTEATNEIIWHDSADHDIGDAIPFKLEMTVPSAFDAFKTNNEKEGATVIPYRFVFHDTEETGLDFQNTEEHPVVVKVDGVQITTGFEIVENPGDGHTFDVIFADMTTIGSIKVGSVVTVEYSSILTEDAVIGSKGNINEVYGEYRNFNNPEKPEFTPKDTVIAFTYKVVINKVDENDEPLSGATFTLEKYNAALGEWEKIERVTVEAETVFTFNGLDDGNYRLTEDVAPDGYNKIAPIEFTVTAEHEIVWSGENRTSVLETLTGNVVTGEIEFTADAAAGSLSSDVENKSGTVLPETGGIGTTIFYALGGMMVLVAVVLLVTKKRMGSAE